jgi:hypothetical protein
MAKRGETRPWRLDFTWETGTHGCSTHTSRDSALTQVRTILGASHARELDVNVRLTNKATGRHWSTEHEATSCTRDHAA